MFVCCLVSIDSVFIIKIVHLLVVKLSRSAKYKYQIHQNPNPALNVLNMRVFTIYSYSIFIFQPIHLIRFLIDGPIVLRKWIILLTQRFQFKKKGVIVMSILGLLNPLYYLAT